MMDPVKASRDAWPYKAVIETDYEVASPPRGRFFTIKLLEDLIVSGGLVFMGYLLGAALT